MFEQVSACLHRNIEKIENMQTLTDALANLDERIKTLNNHEKEVETDITGYADNKNEKREYMALLTVVMQKKLKALASANKLVDHVSGRREACGRMLVGGE